MIYGVTSPLAEQPVTIGGDPVTVGGDPVTITAEIPEPMDANMMIVAPAFTVTDDEAVVRIAVWLRSDPGTDASQRITGGVYNGAGKLVAASNEVVVQPGTDPGWVTFTFDSGAAPTLPGGDDYRVALLVGPMSDGVELYLDPTSGTWESFSQDYDDGLPAHLGSGTSEPGTFVFFMETIRALVVPPTVTDDYIAALPFDVTQEVFGASAPIASRESAVTSWYGTTFDPTTGANAIVRSDGPLADLVGERIEVARRGGVGKRSVFVYVSNEADFSDDDQDADLMLTRRAFLALAPNTLDNLPVEVQVLQ